MKTDKPVVAVAPSEKVAVIENFVGSSKLDGYAAKGALTKSQLDLMVKHKGSDSELHEKLLKAFGG